MRDYKNQTDYAEIGLEFDETGDIWFSVRIFNKSDERTIETFYRTKNITAIKTIRDSCDQAIEKIKEQNDTPKQPSHDWY